MVAENKLLQLAEQIEFLIKLEQDSLDECFQEYGSLMLMLENAIAAEEDLETNANLRAIRDALGENQKKLFEEYQEELKALDLQKKIVAQALTIKDAQKFEAIQELILEEVGALEDMDKFKKRVQTANMELRSDFLQTVNELKEIITEGMIDELADLLDASNEDDQADECDEGEQDHKTSARSNSCCTSSHDEEADQEEDDEGVTSFNLAENEEILAFLKQHAEPYFVEKDEAAAALGEQADKPQKN